MKTKPTLESVSMAILLFLFTFTLPFPRPFLLDKVASHGPWQQVEAYSDIAPEPQTPPTPPAPAASSCWTGTFGHSPPCSGPRVSADSRDRTSGLSWRWCSSCQPRRRWSRCLPRWCCASKTVSCFPCTCTERRKDRSHWRRSPKGCRFPWISKRGGRSYSLPRKPIFP